MHPQPAVDAPVAAGRVEIEATAADLVPAAATTLPAGVWTATQ
jgi:hypothetical protein